jgi:hypothetical protein
MQFNEKKICAECTKTKGCPETIFFHIGFDEDS